MLTVIKVPDDIAFQGNPINLILEVDESWRDPGKFQFAVCLEIANEFSLSLPQIQRHPDANNFVKFNLQDCFLDEKFVAFRREVGAYSHNIIQSYSISIFEKYFGNGNWVTTTPIVISNKYVISGGADPELVTLCNSNNANLINLYVAKNHFMTGRFTFNFTEQTILPEQLISRNQFQKFYFFETTNNESTSLRIFAETTDNIDLLNESTVYVNCLKKILEFSFNEKYLVTEIFNRPETTRLKFVTFQFFVAGQQNSKSLTFSFFDSKKNVTVMYRNSYGVFESLQALVLESTINPNQENLNETKKVYKYNFGFLKLADTKKINELVTSLEIYNVSNLNIVKRLQCLSSEFLFYKNQTYGYSTLVEFEEYEPSAFRTQFKELNKYTPRPPFIIGNHLPVLDIPNNPSE